MFNQEMYLIAYKILKNKEDAEDAVHQAFIAIANNFKKVNEIPCQEIKAYIVIVIKNTSKNLYKKNKRIVSRQMTLTENTVVDDVNFLENYDYEQLMRVISELPEIYKDTIYLHYLQGFTPREVANMLNITIENVWKRIERAKKLLKTKLERNEDNVEI